LQPRVEVIDRRNKTVASGRDLGAIQATIESQDVRSGAWDKAARHWERTGLTEWTFGDLPESVPVEEIGGVALLAHPGLLAQEATIDLRLFRKREEAENVSAAGVRKLAELALAADLRRLWKELAGLAKHIPGTEKKAGGFHGTLQQLSMKIQAPTAAWVTPELLQQSAYRHLLDNALALHPVFPLTHARFQALIDTAHRTLPALTYQLGETTRQILVLRQQVLATSRRYPGMEQDVQSLVPGDFLARTPHAQLAHLLRYLKAIQIRGDRAALQPAKDIEKARQLAPFQNWQKKVPTAKHESFRWLLEEFRVSIFAQELGTAQPVSAQRLKALGGL
jgi:ATP-dependent helicase HrpA